MAEYLLRQTLVREPSLSYLAVVSAGVAAYPGDTASEYTLLALDQISIDASNHRSQRINQDLVERSVGIFGMTQAHLDLLRQQFKEPLPLYLLHHFTSPETSREVPDPIGGSLERYQETRDAIRTAIPSIITFIKTQSRGSCL